MKADLSGVNNLFTFFLATFFLAMVLIACTEPGVENSFSKREKRAVYVLVDTSGSYSKQFDKVQLVMRHLLKILQPGESLALARIDSGSFSEKDIVARMTFDVRPSMANSQKRAFLKVINNFSQDIRVGEHTDIIGGSLQAIEYLNETGNKNKSILLFSDLKKEVRKNDVSDFPVNFNGANVIAMNLGVPEKKNAKPEKYAKRLKYWQNRVVNGSGQWKYFNDLSLLDSILD